MATHINHCQDIRRQHFIGQEIRLPSLPVFPISLLISSRIKLTEVLYLSLEVTLIIVRNISKFLLLYQSPFEVKLHIIPEDFDVSHDSDTVILVSVTNPWFLKHRLLPQQAWGTVGTRGFHVGDEIE